MPACHAARRIAVGVLLPLGLATATLCSAWGGALAASDTTLGKRVYRKANCVGCHKWHGGGGGGYGGAALSLRATPLDADGIREVVRCGRPGTRMPYHDRDAYKGDGCYGMTKAELVDEVARATQLTKKHAEIIVNTVFDSIVTSLKEGEKIELRGFGSFRIRHRGPRLGRNPKTGERVEVPAKRIPYFKPGKELREMLNSD